MLAECICGSQADNLEYLTPCLQEELWLVTWLLMFQEIKANQFYAKLSDLETKRSTYCGFIGGG